MKRSPINSKYFRDSLLPKGLLS